MWVPKGEASPRSSQNGGLGSGWSWKGDERCFIVPCPGRKRTAAALLPLIQRWVLPGTAIYTDGWRAYQQLPDLGYTHSWVNHTLYFKDPVTSVHTNREEGLWKHIQAGVSGSRTLEDSFEDFMMRQHFTTGGKVRGRDRTLVIFNGYLTILKAWGSVCLSWSVLFIFKFNFNIYLYICITLYFLWIKANLLFYSIKIFYFTLILMQSLSLLVHTFTR